MTKLNKQLDEMVSELSKEELADNLVIYIDKPDEEDCDEDITVFYINTEECHNMGRLVYNTLPTDMGNKLLDLLEAGQIVESTYEYLGSYANLVKVVTQICHTLPNIRLSDKPFE